MDKPDRYTGVFIDIFPLDGVPSDKKCQAEFKKNYQKYMFWNYKLRFSIKDVHTIRAKILHFVTAPLRGILPYDYYYKKYIGMISKNDFDTSEFWTYPTTVYRHNYIYRKQIFNDILDHDFENIKIAIPTGYDEFLSQSFGDYMKLPPEEDRIPHHYADFVSFEIPYEEYRR